MRSLSEFLIDIGSGARRSASPASEADKRARYGYLEAWTSIVLNSALAAAKVAFGVLLGSIALLADAAHTASDVATSVVVLAGFRSARAPADERHPFGHGRMETVSALVIAVLLIVVGLEFGWSSMKRLLHPALIALSYPAVLTFAASAVIKEWLARFSIFLGRAINSEALVADAWHHRSDAVASALVAVSMLVTPLGYPWLDGAVGGAVSALIVATGLRLAMSTGSHLVGESPPPEMVEELEQKAKERRGVLGAHKVLVHDYGTHKVVSMHIQVDGDLSVSKAHAIAGTIKHSIAEDMGIDAVIHVEPPAESGHGSTDEGKKPEATPLEARNAMDLEIASTEGKAGPDGK